MILKKELGLKGSREKVLAAVQLMVDHILRDRSNELILKSGRLTAESEYILKQVGR